MTERKKVVLVDFDGTLNSYKSGFDGKRPQHLPDSPNPGAIGWLRRVYATSVYEPVIFTTRVLNQATGEDDPFVVEAIRDWLINYGLEKMVVHNLRITAKKVPCSLLVDDRAFRYEGKFPDPAEMTKLTSRG